MIKEACIETIEQGIHAEQQGADQLELCSRLDLDGLSPSYELTRALLKEVKIPIKVMVRPREGNFRYNPTEVEVMTQQIKKYKKLGVAGIVIGALDRHARVDERTTQILAHIARPLSVTFHKAIDETSDVLDSLRILGAIEGITHVLTSGGHKTAEQGKFKLQELINYPSQIEVIVAGGVTDQNLELLDNFLHATFYHGKKIVGLLK